MENIAHSLAGVQVAALGWQRTIGPRAWIVGMVAANLPDADVALLLGGRDTYVWWHRGITHSFFGWPLLALAGAAISRRWCGQGTWRQHLGLWGAALLSHVLLDWPTTWGTMLFYPLSEVRFALDWIFIIDPMFWVILGGLPWLLARSLGREKAAGWSLAAIGGWILLSGVLHQQAAAQLATGPAPAEVTVFPAALAPLRWTGVRRGPGVLERWWLTPWSAAAGGSFAAPEGPDVDRIRASYVGNRYFWMARAPVRLPAAAGAQGTEVTFADLAFTDAWTPDDFRFTRTFGVAAGGAVTGRDGR
jgi:membrane-bound metal-dependent hydrolase YbcI (DUF457 family)